MIINSQSPLLVDVDGDHHVRGNGFEWMDNEGNCWIEAEAAVDIGTDPTYTSSSNTWAGGNSSKLFYVDKDGKCGLATYANLYDTTNATARIQLKLAVSAAPQSDYYNGRPMKMIPAGARVILMRSRAMDTITVGTVKANSFANEQLSVSNVTADRNQLVTDTTGTRVRLDGIILKADQGATDGNHDQVFINYPHVAVVQA